MPHRNQSGEALSCFSMKETCTKWNNKLSDNIYKTIVNNFSNCGKKNVITTI
jgi:hypothetical protein